MRRMNDVCSFLQIRSNSPPAFNCVPNFANEFGKPSIGPAQTPGECTKKQSGRLLEHEGPHLLQHRALREDLKIRARCLSSGLPPKARPRSQRGIDAVRKLIEQTVHDGRLVSLSPQRDVRMPAAGCVSLRSRDSRSTTQKRCPLQRARAIRIGRPSLVKAPQRLAQRLYFRSPQGADDDLVLIGRPI